MPITERVLSRIKNNINGNIDLRSLNIDDNDIFILIKELRKKQNLIKLNVQRNSLSDASAFLLATLPLQELNIRDNSILDKGLSALLDNSKLLRLDIGNNGLTDSCLNDFLKNENLIFVNLQGNDNISDSILNRIEDHISKNIVNKSNEDKMSPKSKSEEIKEFPDAINTISSKNIFSEKYQDENKQKTSLPSDSSVSSKRHQKK